MAQGSAPNSLPDQFWTPCLVLLITSVLPDLICSHHPQGTELSAFTNHPEKSNHTELAELEREEECSEEGPILQHSTFSGLLPVLLPVLFLSFSGAMTKYLPRLLKPHPLIAVS